MKFVTLLSGGKDSVYNTMKCVDAGHELVAAIHLAPPSHVEELDSWMYQSVGSSVAQAQAECLGVPLFVRTIGGHPVNVDLEYDRIVEGDEVEDLFYVLQEVVKSIPSVEAVASGALWSDYQRIRVESLCQRLNLKSLALLWHANQRQLMQEMISHDLDAIIVKVASYGLNGSHVGKSIRNMYDELCDLEEKNGINVCGEGGEFESLVLDCPLFRKRIVLDETDHVIHSDDAFSPVVFLRIRSFHVEDKNMDTTTT